MRIRTIKPEWLEDERIALASPEARVLSVALLLLADDEGRGRANPTVLAGKVFPGSSSPREDSTKALRELAALSFVVLYEVDGQSYFAIRNWRKHQRIDRPSPSRLPAPPEEDSHNLAESNASSSPREHSSNPRRTIAEPSATDLGPRTKDLGPRSREQSDARAPDAAPVTPGDSPPRVEPTPTAAAPVERMLLSLEPVADVEARVLQLVSSTRQAAGGAPYRATSHHDRETVVKLTRWASDPSIGFERLGEALAAFWAAKSTAARLSWLVEEDPGRFLGQPNKKASGARANVAPPDTHEAHAKAVAAAIAKGRPHGEGWADVGI